MIHNKSILKFTDYSCEYTNKVSRNDFNNKYLTQCIKKIITFKNNYEKSTYKEIYILYNIYGTSLSYCVDYEENNELIQHNTFDDLKLAI